MQSIHALLSFIQIHSGLFLGTAEPNGAVTQVEFLRLVSHTGIPSQLVGYNDIPLAVVTVTQKKNALEDGKVKLVVSLCMRQKFA